MPRTSTPSRRGRSVVHILRRPLITGYMPDSYSDSVLEPAPACNCAHASPAVDEPTVDTPDEPTNAEPATSDEIGSGSHGWGFEKNNRPIQTELDQILNGNEQESEDEWYKRLAAPLLAGVLTFASPNDSVAKPIIDTTKAWVQHTKDEQERRRKIEEDAAARRKQAKKTQQEVGGRVLDEIMAETLSAELDQEDKTEQQRAIAIVKVLVQTLRTELIPGGSKKGRSGSNVRSQIDSRVGAELVRIANNLSARRDLIMQARQNDVGLRTLENSLRAAGNLMIMRAKSNKHPDRREIDP